MINGAHVIVYSKNPEADRKFLRDVIGLSHVDVGGGWLIFAMPPSEIAVHPSDENDHHELFFMCEDVKAFVAAMKKKKIGCGPISDQGWGLITQIVLPGGGKLGVYQPRHARPKYGAAAKKAAPNKAAPKKKTSARKSLRHRDA